ncbi:sulfite exporter TauE/SafE family protein [Paenibacillus larvae]|uniref:Probable membrane transporter protein n=2 Tax=Paenibacillus larvae TaxID=1464 RepID=A0AAP5JXW6_9BACL|nr:sulfite exporter TauE/SafE family protein [Paenibacillus larvae]AQR76964.1 anion permease [Paenibacillus larvae subsp. larvae]MCY7489319.1 sulfite exporter TauE/SafE family protein [Paenibacillus larvae]MCY9562938.1 sulfite exporter TauE/SafE family protein [Paenibacillus larvae]MCY9567853.1 sulfite exporter TauE/SafE family protein [Paenibacillus larvae]MCY9570338.1 sulfite exporter TauE/SafE family protein [Paenibacillus larvae]
MTMWALEILLISVLVGVVGSVLGLGGGIIVTPALTLLFGVDIKHAIGASIISVIATSSGSAIAYIRDQITNVRVGMFLEIATTIGAVTGAIIGGLIAPGALYVIFGLLLLYSALAMIKKGKDELPAEVPLHPVAEKLKLHNHYYDKALQQNVSYNVDNVYGGFGVMYGAGIISGLLGIGSGSFKVMAMDVFMKLPLKVSSATSNFMMGVTAAASAGIYLFRGDIDPGISAPVALGVLIGATVGTRIMQRLKSKTIRKLFIPILIYVSIQMILQAWGIKL